MKQVERGHWSNEAKEYYYAKRAAALGVRERGQAISIHQTMCKSQSVPSQQDMQNALGVHLNTVQPMGERPKGDHV